MADSTSIEVAKQYAIFDPDTVGDYNIAEVFQENIGTELSRFDLDQVKMPSGGATSWIVPTLDGEEEVKSLEGIVLYWKQPRAYWQSSLEESGGGSPPDCTSVDGEFGVGAFGPGSQHNPTGDCEKCPMSQWGSKDGDRKGQACKQMRVLFLLTPGSLLPIAVTLPPTSIKPMKKYQLRLAAKSTPYYAVVTKLELERVKNSDGIAYSLVKPSVGTVLDANNVKMVKEYQTAIRSMLDEVVIDVAASEGPSPEDERI